MKSSPLLFLVLAASLGTALSTPARANDKKKMWEWQQQQQQLQQQWKAAEVQRQQQLLRQQQSLQRSRTAAAAAYATPWTASENGRGALAFTGNSADRLNSAVVTLNNFFDARGNVNNSGSATVTFYGDYAYPLRGTWTMQGNFTVGLNLTPAANAARGDRATGNLTMGGKNGDRLSTITLTGVMSGAPFTASFSAR